MKSIIIRLITAFIWNSNKRKQFRCKYLEKKRQSNSVLFIKEDGSIENYSFEKYKYLDIVFSGINSIVKIYAPVKNNAKLRLVINGSNNVINLTGIPFNSHVIINGDNFDLDFVKLKYVNFTINGYLQTPYRRKIIFEDGAIIHGLTIHCDECSYMKFGKNFLCSYNVTIWGTDGHAILQNDIVSNIHKNDKIEINDHVWIGYNVTILPGVELNTNTVVGACSVVTKKHNESNIVLAGNPAKIIKKNITWDIENPINVVKEKL